MWTGKWSKRNCLKLSDKLVGRQEVVTERFLKEKLEKEENIEKDKCKAIFCRNRRNETDLRH